jgi:hemerythrin-like domain-containing protein
MSPPIDPQTLSTVQAHAEEHRQIRKLLEVLRDIDDGAALATLLDVLDSVMHEHFAHEEQEQGVFAAIRASGPAGAARIDGFVAEHKVFLAGLEEVRARLAVEAGEALDLARAMGVQLAAHEAAENAAVQAALRPQD